MYKFARLEPCPHSHLRYHGGAPFPKWIRIHENECVVIDGKQYHVRPIK